jgi:hypothetical protein
MYVPPVLNIETPEHTSVFHRTIKTAELTDPSSSTVRTELQYYLDEFQGPKC